MANEIDFLDYGIEYTIAEIIVNYNNPMRGEIVDSNFIGVATNKEGVKEYPFTVKRLNKEKLNNGLNWVANNSREKLHIGLSFTMDRIDLLNPLNVKEQNS